MIFVIKWIAIANVSTLGNDVELLNTNMMTTTQHGVVTCLGKQLVRATHNKVIRTKLLSTELV